MFSRRRRAPVEPVRPDVTAGAGRRHDGLDDRDAASPTGCGRRCSTVQRCSSLKQTVRDLGLVTVCEDAGCPNLSECWADGTATFMVLGERCTRACGFCLVDTRQPEAPAADEPARVAEAIDRMGLDHAVLTMVARDDLADGGMAHVAACVDAIRERAAGHAHRDAGVRRQGRRRVARPAVRRPPGRVQPQRRDGGPAAAGRAPVGRLRPQPVGAGPRQGGRADDEVGFIVGMGETDDEIVGCLADLAGIGVDIVTIGQYLRPTSNHLPVARWVEPAQIRPLGGRRESGHRPRRSHR